MKKKVLMLGGAYAQIPVIEEAKRQDLYVITCDYLPDNPGHRLADEYHNISTTDAEAVLALAEKVRPDFIIAYASDPAAPVAAFVSEKLGLPTNSYQSVQTLSEKDLFRQFLHENGLNAPMSKGFSEQTLRPDSLDGLTFPLIVKPTDSSGSKGVVKISRPEQLEDAARYAFSFSRKKRIVIEEFIDTEGRQLHGDGYVLDGQLVFCYLGDHHYDVPVNAFVPYSTTWPSKEPVEVLEQVREEVQRVVSLSGFANGPINIEARYYRNRIYIMEIGPRNGGNFVPQILHWLTGFNMVEAEINRYLGNALPPAAVREGIGAYYVIHSAKDGTLKQLTFDDRLRPFIKEKHIYIQQGEQVKSFQGSNAAIGVVLLQFDTVDQRDHFIQSMDRFILVELA